MRNQTRITILVAIFGLMFCISIASNNLLIDTQENTSQTTETIEELYFKKPITAKSWWDNFSFIHIKGNWSTAANYEWCRGKGTSSNPYIIENITMDASSSPTASGIYIQDSQNDYFKIKNCTVYNNPARYYKDDAGIKLENVNNGTLIDNICNDNEKYGILLLGGSGNCENNTVIENTANNNLDGIVLKKVHDYNNISGNIMNNNYYAGIVLDTSHHNNLTGNTASHSYRGIYLQDSDMNNITDNSVKYNSYGIYLASKFDSSDYNWVINNTLIGNTGAIYECGGCVGNVIKGNIIVPPSSGSGDDDDDDDDDKEAAIPGYDIFLIIGMISVMSIVLLINIEKKKIK